MFCEGRAFEPIKAGVDQGNTAGHTAGLSGIGAAGGSVVLGACCTALITEAPASNVAIQLTFVALGWLEDVFAGCYSYV